jgi:hypothetical protein
MEYRRGKKEHMFPSHCVITEIHLITFQVDINYLLTDSHLKLGLNMKTSVDWHFEHVCLKTTTHHTSVSNPSDSAEQRREMYKFGLHTYIHTAENHFWTGYKKKKKKGQSAAERQ